MSKNFIPALIPEASLAQYLRDIQRFPILSEQEEYELANRLHNQQDIKAAHKLVTSHLRLVAKIALKYKGYGLPMTDLIAEGNIGLMHAVKKFIPELGHRLSTYAMWWIKAYIQDYILKSWSLVKIGTSAVQKRLFFNLRKVKNKLLSIHGRDNIDQDAQEIANQLNVSKRDVLDMDSRLSSQDSLLHDINQTGSEFIDSLASADETPEEAILEKDEYQYQKTKLKNALAMLNERERDILESRLLLDKPITLDELSNKFSISRERVRQIESKAMEKLQRYCLA